MKLEEHFIDRSLKVIFFFQEYIPYPPFFSSRNTNSNAI